MAKEVRETKKRTKIFLIILAVLLVIALAFLITAYLTFRSEVETSTDINDYIAYTSKESDEDPVVMPKLETLGNMTDTDFLYRYKTNVIYDLTVYRLTVSYDEEDYEKEKALLDSRYAYYDSPISETEAKDHALAVDFEYRGYSFRTVRDDSAAALFYPRQMFFVGTNDKKKTIAYIYYEDSELDYLTSFPSFFREEKITVSNKK
ncbi:MAG: hypothetical protein ACI4XE_11935 [Acutalibacteraceae bacterium]